MRGMRREEERRVRRVERKKKEEDMFHIEHVKVDCIIFINCVIIL